MNGYLRFRERFAEAIDTRLYSLDYLDSVMLSGRARCWASENAAIIAEIKAFPSGARAVCGVIAAGALEEIVRLIPLAEEWGQENGCQYGMIDSTVGWQRVMKKHGYDAFQTSLIKTL